MKEHKFDVIILFSGGLDSTVLLQQALLLKMEPFCLLIDYGQKHIKELDYAKNLCTEWDVQYEVITIGNLNVPSKLTDGTVKYEGVSEWHVPSRNLIFIALAASVAEGYNIPLIWYGANFEDREHLFPDCYQEWVYELNKFLTINGSTFVRVEAPLLGMTKDTIKKLAKAMNINENKIFSGYGQ